MDIKELVEMVESAKKIKGLCVNKDRCRDCPFSYTTKSEISRCRFIIEPSEWNLGEEKNNDQG